MALQDADMIAAIAGSNQTASRNMLKIRENLMNPIGSDDTSVFSSSRGSGANASAEARAKSTGSARKVDPKQTKLGEMARQTDVIEKISSTFTDAVGSQSRFLQQQNEMMAFQKSALMKKQELSASLVKKEEFARLVMLRDAKVIDEEEFMTRARLFL